MRLPEEQDEKVEMVLAYVQRPRVFMTMRYGDIVLILQGKNRPTHLHGRLICFFGNHLWAYLHCLSL